jgi:co-chaperonin GroES (HSP10)
MQLISDRILILPSAKEDKIGSIIVPDCVKDNRRFAEIKIRGNIILMGPGTQEYPKPDNLNIGDEIIYSAWCGLEVEYEGKTMQMMRFKDILAKVEQ